MAKSLGIFVTSKNHMRHVVGITKAATAKGSQVKVFFTWKGTHLASDPAFTGLCEIADVSICADSYAKLGYDKSVPPAGLTEKEMSTQSQHSTIINEFDTYITL